MSTNHDFLSILLGKEKELEKQLDALRSTIAIFRNGYSQGSIPVAGVVINHDRPLQADFSTVRTWKGRLVFILKKIGPAFVTDIVAEFLKHTDEYSEEILKARITQLASDLKRQGVLDATRVGARYRYFVK